MIQGPNQDFLNFVEQAKQQEASNRSARQEAPAPAPERKPFAPPDVMGNYHRQRAATRQQVLEALRASVSASGVQRATLEQQQAASDARQAQATLDRHLATSPQRAQVAEWAREKAILESEAEAFNRLHEQATLTLQEEQQAYQRALYAAWEREARAARSQFDDLQARNRQRLQEAQAALQRLIAEVEHSEHQAWRECERWNEARP